MESKMQRKHSPVIITLIILATVVFFGAGVLVSDHVERSQAMNSEVKESIVSVPVRVARVEYRAAVKEARFHGFLAPFEDITVAARVAGEITQQSVDVSDIVEIDQTLFKIDDAVRKIEYDQAVAAQEKAQSEYELALARRQQMQTLDQETSSSMERVESETRYRGSQANKAQAEAVVREAVLLIEWTRAQSPLDGVVSNVYARLGEFVQAGQPLCDVIKIDRLKLLTQLEDHEVVWVNVGQPVIMTTDALPGRQFHGTVSRVCPQALPTNRKFEVEMDVPNSEGVLRPGFFMSGTLTQPADGDGDSHLSGTLVIPREAIVDWFGQHVCYALAPPVREKTAEDLKGTTFEAKRITVEILPIPSDPRNFQVIEGVTEGDFIVIKGQQHLAETSSVRITE